MAGVLWEPPADPCLLLRACQHLASSRGSGAREEVLLCGSEGTAARRAPLAAVSLVLTVCADGRAGVFPEAGLDCLTPGAPLGRRDGMPTSGGHGSGSASSGQPQCLAEAGSTRNRACDFHVPPLPGPRRNLPTVSPSQAGARPCVHMSPCKERDSVTGWKTRTGRLFD